MKMQNRESLGGSRSDRARTRRVHPATPRVHGGARPAHKIKSKHARDDKNSQHFSIPIIQFGMCSNQDLVIDVPSAHSPAILDFGQQAESYLLTLLVHFCGASREKTLFPARMISYWPNCSVARYVFCTKSSPRISMWSPSARQAWGS